MKPSPPPQNVEEVFRSARTTVWVERSGAGARVIVKSPTAPIPDAAELARYRRERAMLDSLAGPGIPRVLDLVERSGTVRLVMEHRGGQSLAAVLAEGRPPLGEALDILEEAAAILSRVHAAGVIHKDVSPANLVWAGQAGSLQLVDFGNAAREGEATTPGRVDGTLRYIAPEATGRSAKPITWRADLYALGATAWHLLVGRPPFEDEDPLALVHAHLARAVEPPAVANPDLPPCLSAVVMRCLEKDPERRYQSAEGLLADLRRCRELIAVGDRSVFALGADDAPPRFSIPTRLYGRESELSALSSALVRASTHGVSLTLVGGPSGIGKSALVEALAGSIRRYGARLIRGRFELLGRDTPLKAWTEACDALVAELVGLDDASLAATRDHLRTSLGEHAGVLAATLPALAALLGPTSATPDLGGQAAAIRALQAHAALLGALAHPDRPLVVFLDDLQWADLASLDLVEFLVNSPQIGGLLLIGGYRDDEVGPAHPLSRTCERLEASGTPIPRVRPGPIDLASATALVADACRCSVDTAAPLAAALHERTDGNPFFLRELLRQMSDSGLLRRRGVGWGWSADAPSRLAFADNVVDAVLERMTLLPTDTARALGVAARIGHRFDVGLLAQALGRSTAEVARALAPAVQAGLVRPETEAWGLLEFGEGGAVSCRFVHDRVQEAALRLLPPEEAGAVHLALARRLTAEGAPTGEALFDALEHYREALTLLEEHERARVARLALDASGEAVRSAAFDVALRVCELGLSVLGRRDQQLWEKLCTRAIEVADASSDTDALDRHTEALIAGASTVAAMGPAYVARVRMETRAGHFERAIAEADAFLARVGHRTETEPRLVPLVTTLLRVLWGIRGRSAEDLVNGPQASDPTQAAVLSVRIATAKALASAHPKVLLLDILGDLDHILRHGVTPDGLFAWSGWALLLTGLRRPDQADRFCELALARAERMGSPGWVGIAWAQHGIISQWRRPLPEVAEALLRVRDRSLELGEFWAGLGAGLLASQIQLFQGALLSEVDLSLRQNLDLARQHRTHDGVASLTVYREVVASLRGPGGPDDELTECTGTFAEQDQLLARLILALFLGDREAGWRAAQEAPAALDTPLQGPAQYIWRAYRAVAMLRAAEAGHLTPAEARRATRPARRLLERWAKAFPERAYRLHWIDAAELALGGERLAALARYETAIDLARAEGVRHDAALMAEQAAELAQALGQTRLRLVLLEEASAGYRQWGAIQKAEQLSALLPSRPTTVTPATTTSGSGDLDLETLFRASVALSGEIRLDHLAGEVVAVTMQNAGATRGFLVVERDGQLRVEVGRDAEGAELIAAGTPLQMASGLATTVVRYVARTGEQLVLADGRADPRFASDPHLSGSGTSILCAPLDHNGRRAGIIYLENHLVPGCFTPERLRTVRVLAAQAAVSIQNANLVDTLEGRVADRTRALQEQHQQLLESNRALAQSEKMASLGQLVAGVAHELNTPLGAIGASVGNLSAALDGSLAEFSTLVAAASPEEFDGLRALILDVGATGATFSTREEREARSRLEEQLKRHGIADARAVARRLVTMGMSGDIDPHLALLRSPRAEALLRMAVDLTALRRNSATIRTAVDRAAKIVFALKSYAHPGSVGGEPTSASLAENLNTVLTLYENQMKHGVELVRTFEDPGVVRGWHDELNQVWTNLIHNALQAMQYRGRLELRLTREDQRVIVQIADSGPGIPEAVVDRIFEPFYTTKAQGEGSGLGLSISRRIVERHFGTITVQTRPGRTVFTVALPTED